MSEGGIGLTEMNPLLRKKLEQSGTAEFVYQEAAYILEKGKSNDHLEEASGFRTPQNIRFYRLVHSNKFFALDLVACLVLIGLALVESPAVFQLNVRVHCGIEIAALVVIGALWAARYRWLGRKTFIRESRSVIKGIALIVLLVEALVIIKRQKVHFRITRILRPIFLIDNHFLRTVRRYLRQVLRSVPAAVEVAVLFVLSMVFFSIMGFFLFSMNDKSNFGSLLLSLQSLLYLSTATDFPDVMMPSYSKSRWTAVFFVAYMSIVFYFLTNLITAVVYASFTIHEKDKIKKLLLHRREAALMTYRILTERRPLTINRFFQLIRHLDSSKSFRDTHLMFRLLNESATGEITETEFQGIYNVLSLKWAIQRDELSDSKVGIIYRIVTNRFFQWAIYGVIAVDTALLIYVAASGTNQVSIDTSLAYSLPFLTVYTADVIVKIVALGTARYFRSGWNCFDLAVTLATYVGLVLELVAADDSNLVFLFTVRNIRILRLFKLSKSYRGIFGAVFILSQRLLCAAAVFLIYYYCYAILGMELFGKYNLTSCCKNTSVESKFKPDSDEHYYLLSFRDLISSLVTLFVLTVGANWDNIMNGHAYTVSKWSRLYFVTYFFTTLLLLSIVVASALDIFLCRITYKQKVGKIEERAELESEVLMTKDEFERIVEIEEADTSLSARWKRLCSRLNLNGLGDHVTFIGRRPRNTKHFLLTVLYKEEIEQWMKEDPGRQVTESDEESEKE